jgi:general secretion pathway protein D
MTYQHIGRENRTDRETSWLAKHGPKHQTQNNCARPDVSSAGATRDGTRSPGASLVALLVLALTFCFAATLHAQFPGGGFPNFGGGQNTTRSRTSGQYPNNQVGDATFAIDPDTRKLVVIADEDTTKYISEVVSNLSRPKPQVLIKVVFLEVTRNDSLDIGIEGSFGKDIGNNGIVTGYRTNFVSIPTQSSTGNSTNVFISGNTIVPTNLTPIIRGVSVANAFGLANSGGPAGLYQIFSQDYTATIRAIATAGKAKVLSRPSVVARNNQPATITVGQSVPLITNVRFDTFGNAINSVTYQSVGIILRVTPFITSDGLIEMILSPETSELVQDRTQWVPISSGPGGTVSAPLINSRSADTVVVTPDGQTVIIGGLMQNAKAESVTKIPYLGDIPLLGNLFKHKITTDGRTELIIFLTPYIIRTPTEMASVSDREGEKSDAIKALNERELNKFLDTLPATNQPPKSVSPKKRK